MQNTEQTQQTPQDDDYVRIVADADSVTFSNREGMGIKWHVHTLYLEVSPVGYWKMGTKEIFPEGPAQRIMPHITTSFVAQGLVRTMRALKVNRTPGLYEEAANKLFDLFNAKSEAVNAMSNEQFEAAHDAMPKHLQDIARLSYLEYLLKSEENH